MGIIDIVLEPLEHWASELMEPVPHLHWPELGVSSGRALVVQGEQEPLTNSLCLQVTCGIEGQVDWRLGVSLQVGLFLHQGTGQEC